MNVGLFLVVGGLFGLWLTSGSRGDRVEDFLAESNLFRPSRWWGIRHFRAWRFVSRTDRAVKRLERKGQSMEAMAVWKGAAIHSDRIRRGMR